MTHLGEFLNLTDDCRGCGDEHASHAPVGIAWLSDQWVRLVYVCPNGHRWTCGWARELGDSTLRYDEQSFIYDTGLAA